MALFSDLRRNWRASALERSAKRNRSASPGRFGSLPRWALILSALAIFALLYWGALGWIMSDTTADLSLRPAAETLPAGGSVTAAMAAALTERNTQMGGWTPNDIFLKPTAFLSEMPAFQTGQHSVVAGTVAALANAMPEDDGLASAREHFAVPPDRAVFNGEFPFVGGSAASRYREGADALEDYNRRLGEGTAIRSTDSSAASAILGASLTPLAASARVLDVFVRGEPKDMPIDADVLHARVRGEAYAATLLLRAMRDDYEAVLRMRQLSSSIIEAVEALDRIAADQPLLVGEDDLTEQAYFLRIALGALFRVRTGLGGA